MLEKSEWKGEKRKQKPNKWIHVYFCTQVTNRNQVTWVTHFIIFVSEIIMLFLFWLHPLQVISPHSLYPFFFVTRFYKVAWVWISLTEKNAYMKEYFVLIFP